MKPADGRDLINHRNRLTDKDRPLLIAYYSNNRFTITSLNLPSNLVVSRCITHRLQDHLCPLQVILTLVCEEHRFLLHSLHAAHGRSITSFNTARQRSNDAQCVIQYLLKVHTKQCAKQRKGTEKYKQKPLASNPFRKS